ncbi:gastrula zinc finger protein XlCGF48.2-like [Amblyraja radiata]|uniref:gastrula zinc finger protein XlCGF48.2-like n=1 Tax=Amblyraja radiata TaxID=386614 RepID=UPI001402CBBD|nr:gastrula zinc finger protein XlCGF48.2-like [Amblyraja radiata]
MSATCVGRPGRARTIWSPTGGCTREKAPSTAQSAARASSATTDCCGTTASTQARGPFSCSDCCKSFKTMHELKMQLRVHTGEKLFSCSTCGKSFARLSGLGLHRRVHSSERSFTCSGCDKGFKSSSDLLMHRQVTVQPVCGHNHHDARGQGSESITSPTKATSLALVTAPRSGLLEAAFVGEVMGRYFSLVKARVEAAVPGNTAATRQGRQRTDRSPRHSLHHHPQPDQGRAGIRTSEFQNPCRNLMPITSEL